MNHRTAIIGLGIMGQRMLGNMHRYPGFDVVAAWDPDDAVCDAVHLQYPDVAITPDADTAIARDDVEVVYIACPPRFHAEHANKALRATKAVYCEKPLDVDAVRARALIDHANDAGCVNIVNFSLAGALATTEIERRLRDGVVGDVVGVDIRLHFATWPRDWQMAAADWLSFREDGGFTREVLSHWIYLAQRLLGVPVLQDAAVRYPPAPAAETHVTALLEAGGAPVSVAASVGGRGPDLVEATLWGTRQSLRIIDWNRLYCSDGGAFEAALRDVDDPREAGYRSQLKAAHDAVAGANSPMPTFAEAFAVQAIIEDILARETGSS